MLTKSNLNRYFAKLARYNEVDSFSDQIWLILQEFDDLLCRLWYKSCGRR